MNSKLALKLVIIVVLIILMTTLSMFIYNLGRPFSYTEEEIKVLGEERGTYNYVIYLKPNTIYNSTKLDNAEFVYRKLVKSLDIKYHYTVDMVDEGEIKLKYNYLIKIVVPDKIEKILYKSKYFKLENHSKEITLELNDDSINLTKIDLLIGKIETESGLRIQDYNIEFITKLNLLYRNNITLTDNIETKLVMNILKRSELGDIIKFSSDNLSKTLSIKNTNIIYTEKIEKSYLYGGALTLSTIGFIGISIFYSKRYGWFKFKLFKDKNILDELKRFKDLIIKLDNDIEAGLKTQFIKVNSFKDILKLSDILSKPIYLYTDDTIVRLYVIDMDRIYLYNELIHDGQEEKK